MISRRAFLGSLPVMAGWCAFPALASAASAGGAVLSAPESVSVGEAFFVKIVCPREARRVKVSWLGEELSPVLRPIDGHYENWLALGVGLGAKAGGHRLRVELATQGKTQVLTQLVQVSTRTFPEQHLKVAKKMVHLSKESLDRHYREKKLMKAALARRSPERFWDSPFVRPVPGSMSSAFGLRRFFNGEPRAPHRGVDLRGAKGTPIKAFAAGEVVLTGNFYFSGNAVFVDHGQGMVSLYCHMSHIDVKEGQFVSAGQILGQVGSTGRVTGPHLHFGLSVMGNMVDAMPIFAGKGVPTTRE
ncbi:M23 family metallopeptidase [Desulfobaculum bizertense]|uniref:M23 family metallopeptidase n=1 Tax=Desulfobaculum bizertense TaxID=376490 RepID=UPI001F283D73|nr:M23 family metallopeptidase [Desulfobaculum bizertense]UIJ39374.1 M23 family metallopeptidase [Desulfobaculum bizertense]